MSFLFKTVLAASTDFEKKLGDNFFKFGSGLELKDVIQNTVNFLFNLAYFFSIVFLVFSGVLFITSSGDKSKVETAKNSLKSAVIGLILLITFNLLVNFLVDIFGGSPNYIDTLPVLIQK